MLHKSFVVMLASFMLLAACSAPAAETAPPANAPVSASSTQPAAAQPTAGGTAASAAQSPQPASGATATRVTPTGATEAANATNAPASAAQPASGTSNAYHLVLVQDGTQARFRVKEQLAGRNLPSDAVGTTQAVTGSIVIQPDGKIDSAQSRIVVDVTSLRTDESRRDNFIKRNTLQVDQYPTATFVPTTVQGLPSPLPASGTVTFQITGDLTIHGATKPATWQVQATLSGQEMKGTASAAFKFEDFNMTAPRAAVVLSVEDNIRLELDFHLVRQS